MALLNRVFNWKFAIFAFLLALAVALINAIRNDWGISFRAGGVQLVISFLSAGIGAKLIEWSEKRWNLSVLTSYFKAILIGLGLKLLCGWLGHAVLNKTPELGISIILPALGSTAMALFYNVYIRNLSYVQSKPWLSPLTRFLS